MREHSPKLIGAIAGLERALMVISAEWQTDLSDGYPFHKDLDELIQDVQDWKATHSIPSSVFDK